MGGLQYADKSFYKDRDLILDNVRKSIENNLKEFLNMNGEDILNHRKNKFLKIGRSKGFVSQLDDISALSMKKNKINVFIEKFFRDKKNSIFLIIFLFLVFSYIYFL